MRYLFCRFISSLESTRLRTSVRVVMMASQRPSSDLATFREYFRKAKYIVFMTGAGCSAESGIPTFRGAGGLWRTYQAQDLASPTAFAANPSLVWEFYSHRREVAASKEPNKAHIAIAECEQRLAKQGRSVVVITQNIDELHRRAGSKKVLELHGTLYKTRCTKCGIVVDNYTNPIVPALAGKGLPDPNVMDARIPVEELPKCSECGALTRPHVVWFSEALFPDVLGEVDKHLEKCDLYLVVGNLLLHDNYCILIPCNETARDSFHHSLRLIFHFKGPAGETLPKAIERHPSELSDQ
ncbi:NAD-dependent protein deacylase sirtuin-5, mitochondrial-like [Anneissia japonica]|uniref:NAD-dependent protein deacylase sirtuin-5, mitochondrial-like n=1 Tax=Anneissia japonica TaxID=1529436 RepID=UPI00142589CE|nr:NAD-dependent protein deacylase sirtuin-5, mitochondrial-like [Anneissia japonica]